MSLLVVHVDDAETDAASDWLWSLGATAIEERSAEGTLIAGFASADDALAVRSVIEERWPTRFELPPDEAEWRDVWLRYLQPVAVAGLTIHPPWRLPPEEGAIDSTYLSIDPGRAFGSGHHVSTQLAVEALVESIRPGDSVLDVGCGTGVLSIVSVAIGAAEVLGIDVDLDITELARTNAEANGQSESRISFSTEDIANIDQSYDLVVANMTIGTVTPLLDYIGAAARRHVILSGLLLKQLERVEESFQCSASRTWSSGEWTAALFER